MANAPDQPMLNGMYDAVAAPALNSQIAYKADVDSFCAFVRAKTKQLPLPTRVDEHLLAAWVEDMQQRGLVYSTIRRRLAGVAAWCAEWGGSDPRRGRVVSVSIERARKVSRSRTVRRLAVFSGGMRAMIDKLDGDYEDGVFATKQQQRTYLRDRLVILMLYAGVMTRLELATLRFEDVQVVGHRMTAWVNASGEVTIRDGTRSWANPDKTREIVFEPADDLAYDVLGAFKRWKTTAGITEGYLIRGVRQGGVLGESLHANNLRVIVARAAAAAGLVSETADDSESATPKPRRRDSVSPRSLRAGALGDHARDGASIPELLDLAGVLYLQDGLADAVAKRRSMKNDDATAVLNS